MSDDTLVDLLLIFSFIIAFASVASRFVEYTKRRKYHKKERNRVTSIPAHSPSIKKSETSPNFHEWVFDEYGIDYLYHMTHKNNLNGILKHGLVSHNLANVHRYVQKDISNKDVNVRRSRNESIFNRSIHEYVPLYFNPKNPMLYFHRFSQADIVILAIDANLLNQSNTIFSDGNAASGSSKFYDNPDDLIHLNWKCIKAKYWGDYQDGRRIRCAEALVYSKIPIESIKKVFCINTNSKKYCENLIDGKLDLSVEVRTELYFTK